MTRLAARRHRSRYRTARILVYIVVRAVPALLAAQGLGDAERPALYRGHPAVAVADEPGSITASCCAHSDFPIFFTNSLIVSGSTAFIVDHAAPRSPAMRCRASPSAASTGSSALMLVTQMFPLVMLVAPIFKMLSPLGLTNSLTGLVIVYTAFNVPFATFLMQSFFDGIPKDLEEAAMIDGATRFGAFRQIILPLTLPGIAATLGFVFTAAWSELLFALMLISGNDASDLPGRAAHLRLEILGRLRADDGGGRAGAHPGLPLLPPHPALSRAGPDGRRGEGLNVAWLRSTSRTSARTYGAVAGAARRRSRRSRTASSSCWSARPAAASPRCCA